MEYLKRSAHAGFSFIELIFVTAISVLIFGALFVSFQNTLELVSISRAKLSALSLANERMEFFRSLPYDEVGTITGVVRGPVPNGSVLSLNGIAFTERVVIDYVDGVGDGIGGADSNGILTDYKQVKLEYTWDYNGDNYDLSLVSNIMPRSIETNVGGGSIRVNVLDQDFMPLPGATVIITNASSTAPLFESRVSNMSGEVLLSGVPVDSNYQIQVGGPIGGDQYSTSSTYIADASIPNPTSPAFSVSEGGISTLSFIIGELSDITVTTLSDIAEGSAVSTFANISEVASTTDTTAVVSDDLVLADALGVYEPAGVAYLTPVAPATLESWETIKVASNLDVGTSYVVRLYTGDASSGYTLIPDSELLGNGVGFTDSLIDISELDVFLYPTTTVGISLSTTDTSRTPEIAEVAVYWRESSTVRAGQPLFIRGNKILGTDTGGAAIYKATSSVTTDGSGRVELPLMEFDMYTATTTSAFDLATACPAQPFTHEAGVDSEIELVYVPSAAETLRVIVRDTLGRSVPGANVRLDRTGYDVTQTTNVCGQTFFTGGLADATDYELTVSVAGYTTRVITSFTVSGDTTTEVILSPW